MTMSAFNTATSSFESTMPSDYNATESTIATSMSTNTTQPSGSFECIPWEVGFVVMASVGSLVVFLVSTILVLACQVCRLQRHRRTGRHTRSNVDLVSGAGYWGAGPQAEGGGIVGPCDTSVMLEEVKAQDDFEGSEEDEDEDRSEERSEVVVTEDSRGQPGLTVAPVGELVAIGESDNALPIPPPPPPPPMPGSTSTDSCMEMGKNLEGMPLVV